jgi:phosphoadenosine phosphosulfate reductase
MDAPHFQLLKDTINTPNAAAALAAVAKEFPGQVVFSSSFSWEDQAITHLILSHHIPIVIFTLDTGRLFSETYDVWMRTNRMYNTRIKSYCPDSELLEEYLDVHGSNAFYESVELRKRCCFVRKVEPLQRALKGNKVWITGQRREHSNERNQLPKLEWDEGNEIAKYHPLLDWSTEELKQYINTHNVPYNTLHEKGFVSIGCAPCTRAVKEGEDFRAGRWWWEKVTHKECGLHRSI